MNDRYLLLHYAICTIAAYAAWTSVAPVAGIAAFVVVSGALSRYKDIKDAAENREFEYRWRQQNHDHG
jgi:hypothetical protein